MQPRFHAATISDLPAINQMIEAAVMTWDLPDRVKRLSLPSYRYTALDLNQLTLIVARDANQQIVGVAAWERAAPGDCPADRTGLLLHGLYVDPVHQHKGFGRALLQQAIAAAAENHYDGLLVKAQADAAGFFKDQGLLALTASDPARQYAHRYWLAIPRRD